MGAIFFNATSQNIIEYPLQNNQPREIILTIDFEDDHFSEYENTNLCAVEEDQKNKSAAFQYALQAN